MIYVAVEERSGKNMKYSEDEVEEMEIANSDDEKEKEEEEEGTPDDETEREEEEEGTPDDEKEKEEEEERTPSNKRLKTLPETSDSPKAVSGGQARGSRPSSPNSKERFSK